MRHRSDGLSSVQLSPSLLPWQALAAAFGSELPMRSIRYSVLENGVV